MPKQFSWSPEGRAMTIHDWSEIATIAQGVTALIAAILIYRQIKSAHKDNLQQIEEQREENRKWKTLDICSQYEFSDQFPVPQAKFKLPSIAERLLTKFIQEFIVMLKLF
jgi:hypothetical protein